MWYTSRPRKRAQLIERVKEEWASIDQETTKRVFKNVFWSAKATVDITLNTENHSTFEKPVSLTHAKETKRPGNVQKSAQTYSNIFNKSQNRSHCHTSEPTSFSHF